MRLNRPYLLTALLLTIFTFHCFASAAKEKIIYSFQGGSDGAAPFSDLVADKDGNLYGTTNKGGTSCSQYGCGTVFELEKTADGWTHKVIYTFTGNGNDEDPIAGLVIDDVGNLYGTTPGFLSIDFGSVFELTRVKGVWQEKVLYNFTGGSDGRNPSADLVLYHGDLYGVTYYAGNSTTCVWGCGTVFELVHKPNDTWTEKTLYDFAGAADAAHPSTPLMFDADGNAYGMTTFGGGSGLSIISCNSTGGCGTVYKLSPGANGTWSESVLYSFVRGNRSGVFPSGGPIFDQAGEFVGMDEQGGDGYGTVMKLELDNGRFKQKNLHEFSGGLDGVQPIGRLVVDSQGSLFGATEGNYYPGQPYGTVFELQPAANGWQEIVLHVFKGSPDGYTPQAGPFLDSNHHIYGTTQYGGTGTACEQGCGTVYEITP